MIGCSVWVSRSARRAIVFSECPCGRRDKVSFGQILNAFGEGHKVAFFKLEKLVKKYFAGKWQDFTTR
jgi:hypothetical protein